MFPRGGGGFGWGGGVGPSDLPVRDGPVTSPPCPPMPQPSPSPAPPPVGPAPTSVRIVDALYGDVPGAEVTFLERDARVPFSATGLASDGSGNILSYVVPAGQTLLISDVEFYAQRPNPLIAGDQLAVDGRQLQGYLGLHFLVDDRSPTDLYADVDPPKGAVDARPVRGSVFSAFGKVIGGTDRQPRVYLRAREGQTVRLAYSVVRAPVIVVDHIGAALRGYLVPTTIFAAKTAS